MSARQRAQSHVAKAEEFLLSAELSLDVGLLDAATGQAITAGINAKDAICLVLAGTSRKSDDHGAAVAELAGHGTMGKRLAPTFSRLLRLKGRSQYSVESMTQKQARDCVEWARRMVSAAKETVAS